MGGSSNGDFEFPTLIPKDTNDIVIVVPNKVFGIAKRVKKGDLVIPKEFVDLGELVSFRLFPNTGHDFLSKIGEETYVPNCFKEVYVISFKTLLAGYRLFQKDIREFRRVLAAAKTEEEFCTLAGLS